MKVADIKEYVTVREAAKIIGRSLRQTYQYIQDRRLPAICLGPQRYLILRSDAQNFVPPPRGNPLLRRRNILR